MKTIVFKSIKKNLHDLERLYNQKQPPRKTHFYAKLAILELCGWIEETMDRVVKSCAVRNLKVKDNRNYINDNVVSKTYGFQYQEHFRRMLIQVIGLRGVERMERQVDANKMDALKSTLKFLKPRRDTEAHTHSVGTTRIIDAPSVTLQKFQTVYEGLMEIDRVLKRLNC